MTLIHLGGLLSLKFYDLCGLNCEGHYTITQDNYNDGR